MLYIQDLISHAINTLPETSLDNLFSLLDDNLFLGYLLHYLN